jgi:hypothetical protein
MQIAVTDPDGDALEVVDGAAYASIPALLDGWTITAVQAHVTTVSSSGAVNVQLRNVTDSVDILSTPVTIDSGEKDSATAATPPVVNGANAVVANGDELRVDIDGAGTGTKGLILNITLEEP